MYINYGHITISWDWHNRRAICHCHDINLDNIYEKWMLRINFIINDHFGNSYWQCSILIYAWKNYLLSLRYCWKWFMYIYKFIVIQNNYTMHIFAQVKGDPYAKVNCVIIRQWQLMKLLCCIEKFVTSKRKKDSHGMVNCICTPSLKGLLETMPTLYYDKIDTYCIW